jgi:hypothetical protein
MMDDVEQERARLKALVADLKARLKKANAELAALPKRKRGRPVGCRSPKESVNHNHRAARAMA